MDRARYFAQVAERSRLLWLQLQGKQVVHKTFGTGTVTEVKEPQAGSYRLLIAFPAGSKKFNSTAFSQGFFSDVPLAPKLEEKFQTLAKQETERRAEQRREAEEQALALAEQQEAREEFQRLLGVHGIKKRAPDPLDPLFPILKRFEELEELEECDHKYLREQGFSHVSAHYHEARYQQWPDPWHLISACRHWRAAGKPDRALDNANRVLASLDDELGAVIPDASSLSAAALTTQGGALRDLRRIPEAEESARKAIDAQPHDCHAYNLMGAISYEKGEFERGDHYFERARELGSTGKVEDQMVRSAVTHARDRESVARYLLAKDPVRYNWAFRYLPPDEKEAES